MGIQINGQTDTVTSTTAGGKVTVTPASFPSVDNLNATGIVTASSFRGALTGNVNATGLSTFSGGLLVGTGASVSSPATNVLVLGTNNVEVIRISSGGAVGLGTANPQERLHNSITANNQNYLRLDNPSGTSYYGLNSSGDTEINAATNNNIIFKTFGTERSRIDSSGRLSVGTTSSSGSTTNIAPVIAGNFTSFTGSVASIPSGTATTLFTLPDLNAHYLVNASMVNTADANNYTCCYFVSTNSTNSAAIGTIRAGGLLTLSLSGMNVRATQGSGITVTVSYSVTRIATF